VPSPCFRSYGSRGYWETRYELQASADEENEVSFAYAPFITNLQASAGPKVLYNWFIFYG
jgi:hypothetical protein